MEVLLLLSAPSGVQSDRRKTIRDLLCFSLESRWEAQIRQIDSVFDAFDCLIDERPIDLIICEDTETNDRLFKFLLSVHSEIPILVIRNEASSSLRNFPDLKVLGYLTMDRLTEDLHQSLQEAVAKGLFQMRPRELEYVRIKTELLIKVVPLQADIYIQLSRIKFIRLFSKGDIFDSKDLEHFLLEKKVKYLYLKKSDSEEFLKRFKQTLATILKRSEVSSQESPQFAISVHEAVSELGSRIGFTPEVQEIVRSNVQNVIHGIRTNESLRHLLDRIQKSEANYICSHSVLTAHVACAIAMQVGWNSDTTFEKLVLASFLHDITLKNPHLALIDSMEEFLVQKSRFSEEENKQFLHHPQDAAELVRRFNEIPPDVDTIILQQHERPDGTGFPRKLAGAHISSLSAIFILSHDLVQTVYKKEQTPEEVIAHYQSQAWGGSFKKIIQALLPLTQNLEKAS